MGKILGVYTEYAFKEYILPSINNSDYEIVLNKNLFCLSENLVLKLEVLEGVWNFHINGSYHILKNEKLCGNCVIGPNDVFKIWNKGELVLSIIIKERDYIFTPYEKYDLSGLDHVFIGGNIENDICYSFEEFVSDKHAYFSKTENEWMLTNTSENGRVFVNGECVIKNHILKYGDYINIVGLHMVYMGNVLAIDTGCAQVQILLKQMKLWMINDRQKTMAAPTDCQKILFHRAPRSVQKIETDPIEVEAPPNPEKAEQMSWFMAIGPSFTMAIPMILSCVMMILFSGIDGSKESIYMYTNLVIEVVSIMISVFWTLKNQWYHKKKIKEKELHRYEAYSTYLLKKADEVKKRYEHNMEALKQRYVSAEQCLKYTEFSDKLWNRNPIHPDFLIHRLGIGNIPFQAPIHVPKEHFSLTEDSLTDKPQYIFDNYKTLFQVPIELDLIGQRLIGIVGGSGKKGALAVAKLLSVQLAANNCYVDVKMAFAYDRMNSADEAALDFAKWLPHTWSEERNVRYIGRNRVAVSELFFELTKIFQEREKVLAEMETKLFYPHIVLFISEPELLEGEPLAKYVFDESMNYGLTTVLLVSDRSELPNNCRFIVENTQQFHGMYDVMSGEDQRVAITFDNVSDEQLERFSRRLSNIKVQEIERGRELPQELTFFQMYQVKCLEDFHILDRWKKNRIYDNIKGLIGQKAGGRDCYLDVHEKYHGPHGLIAGTTGSGKSEMLQTYMLSLAINYSPEDLGYFIIDYKGGGIASLFAGLPHLIGHVSNLSGNQINRVMVSIKSENRRRRQIFKENGVNNINSYTKLYKSGEILEPIPHLFIIIDEFSELKREEPGFMRELISVAQIGRSLGVHLILATQNPTGVVDDNIWYNSKFRLCMRVQDQHASNEMIHKPDAAYITQVGRCYLQVGNDEVFELFQSGYSGAVYLEEDHSVISDSVHLISSLGKVEGCSSFAKNQQQERQVRKWLLLLEKAYQYAIEQSEMPALTDRLVALMYQYLEEQGIEYSRSSINGKYLLNFIDLYQEAEMREKDIISYVSQSAKERRVKLPQLREKTQLEVVKEYLARVAEENGYANKFQLWMPALPERLYLSEFGEFCSDAYYNGVWKRATATDGLDVIIGKIDNPGSQQQMPLVVSLSEGGHVAVCGSVGSGKSCFLQSFVYALIMKYAPEVVHIYVLDFNSKMLAGFKEAPHIGAVMYEDDGEKIAKFFYMLKNILKERKQLFQGSNYSQYIKTHGMIVPAIVIVIDNYSLFNEKTGEVYQDFMVQLSKEGLAHGMYMVLSAAGFNRAGIPLRIAENIMNVFAIQQMDKFEYGDVLGSMKFDVLPENGVKGRGLTCYGRQILEFQTALALETNDDYIRLERIKDLCEDMRVHNRGREARKIPQIPENPVWQDLTKLEEMQNLASRAEFLPIGYNAVNALIYALNLRNIYCFLIMGSYCSGKKNCMRAMLESALMKQGNVCIIDSPAGLFAAYQKREGVSYLTQERQIFEYFNQLIPVLTERKQIRESMVEKDCDEDKIFDRMLLEQPYFFFLPDFAWFVQMVQVSEYKMEAFLKNILMKGNRYNLYFFSILSVENSLNVRGTELFQIFSSYRTGIHFGGNVAGNHVLDFDCVPFKEKIALQKAGIGMLSDKLAEKDTLKIVVPFMGRKND